MRYFPAIDSKTFQIFSIRDCCLIHIAIFFSQQIGQNSWFSAPNRLNSQFFRTVLIKLVLFFLHRLAKFKTLEFTEMLASMDSVSRLTKFAIFMRDRRRKSQLFPIRLTTKFPVFPYFRRCWHLVFTDCKWASPSRASFSLRETSCTSLV